MDFPPTFQQNVNAIFVKLDKAADHVPIVSYASNAVNLFQKIIVLPLLDRYSPGTIEKNHYLTHIQDKKTSDCILLIIPGASMFIYLGEKAFSNANKNLDEDLKHFKTKDNETVVKNQESKKQESKKQEELLAAVPPKLKTYEIERNTRIEKNLPQLSSKVENLVVQLENHLAENNHSLEEAFSTPFDSSTENITMESFIEKFNSQVNLRLKVVDQLKNNYSDLSWVKTLIIDCKNANIPIPLTPNQKDKLINQLNAQIEIYNELHHDLAQLYKWGDGELGRAQLKLKKDEYPCVVANFISNPPSNITIQNKSDLELLIKAYKDYLSKLKNTNKNLDGMIGMRKGLLNEMKGSQNPESIEPESIETEIKKPEELRESELVLELVEIERNARLEKNLPKLIPMLENLKERLEADLAENKNSIQKEFSIRFDSSTDNINMGAFVDKLNSHFNPRFKILYQLKNNYSQIANFKALLTDCKDAKSQVPLTSTQKDSLIDQLNFQIEYYDKLSQNVEGLHNWSEGQLTNARAQLEKNEYPFTMVNIIPYPKTDMIIHNKANLQQIIKVFNDYSYKLEKIGKKLEDMRAARQELLNQMNEIQIK